MILVPLQCECLLTCTPAQFTVELNGTEGPVVTFPVLQEPLNGSQESWRSLKCAQHINTEAFAVKKHKLQGEITTIQHLTRPYPKGAFQTAMEWKTMNINMNMLQSGLRMIDAGRLELRRCPQSGEGQRCFKMEIGQELAPVPLFAVQWLLPALPSPGAIH